MSSNIHLPSLVVESPVNIDITHELEQVIQRKPPLLKVSSLVWRFACREALRGENVMIRGETGCGKTLLAMSVAEALGRPFFYLNMGSTQDARSTLIGNTHFAKGKGTYLSESYFVQAIKTPNAIILLDEVSRAHSDAHNILMTVLDKRQRYLRIDESPDTPTISVAPGVMFISTANVGSEYTSTRTMDRAFIDRWTIVVMEPLSRDDEIDLLSSLEPTLSGDIISAIADIAEETRNQVKSDNPMVDTIISTRVTVKMAALCSDGFTLMEAIELCVFPLYPTDGGTRSPQGYMRTFVQQFETMEVKKLTPFPPKIPTSGPATVNTQSALNPGFKTPWISSK